MFSQHGCLRGVCPSAHVHSYQGGADLEVSPSRNNLDVQHWEVK